MGVVFTEGENIADFLGAAVEVEVRCSSGSSGGGDGRCSWSLRDAGVLDDDGSSVTQGWRRRGAVTPRWRWRAGGASPRFSTSLIG